MEALFNVKLVDIRVSISEKSNQLAQVELSYGSLRIKGYRVVASEYGDGLFVSPPSIPSKTGKYIWTVQLDNPEDWKILEGRIKQAYKETKAKYEEEMSDVKSYETINPEDIPF